MFFLNLNNCTKRIDRKWRRYIKFRSNFYWTCCYKRLRKAILAWARGKVDWYDPFINKDDELLNEVDKKTLTVVKKGYW